MIYTVLVKPSSKKGPLVLESIAEDGTPLLTVYLREKPIDGAANTALVATLARHFCVAKSRVIIKTGTRGRHKLVEIETA